MDIVICEKVGKARSDQIILDGVDLRISEGEIFFLIGPSMSGKTTLLSTIAGLSPFDRGKITLFDQTFFPGEKRTEVGDIGMVFDTFSLSSYFTIFENLLFPLLSFSMDEENCRIKVMKQLALMGLDKKRDVYPGALSRGEAQLVTLARALLNDPSLLILDHPLSEVDHQTGMRVMTMLRSLSIERGITILMSTHDTRLFPFAHRLGKIDRGVMGEIIGESSHSDPSPPYVRI